MKVFYIDAVIFESRNLNLTIYNETKRKTLMICDDKRDMLEFFELVFQRKYDLILVDSGEECIDKYLEAKNRGNKIHLILLDYKLGGMPGDSVARKIKEYNGTKIILISAYDVDDELVKELQDGKYITKYIQKTIDTDRLVELVTEIAC
jgi:CheY-like chemotaxis protein